MSVAYQTLVEKYRREDDEQLLERHSAGTLTEDGYNALEDVLRERDVEVPSRPREATESCIDEPRISKRWWLAIAILFFVAWSVFSGSSRDQRLNKAVERATQNDGAGIAFAKYKSGADVDQTEFNTAAQAIVARTNKRLPQKIDEVTTFNSAKMKDNRVFYNYTLGEDLQVIDSSAFSKSVYKQIVPSICGDAPASFFLSHGVELVYAYQHEDGTPFTQVAISEADCSSR